MKYAFAHRGGRGHGPDNTIPTFAEALSRGATGLETDAWVTADGVVVLDHDGIHRAGQPEQQPITEIAHAELADHIPTLSELFEACGTGYELAIDVKGDGAAEAIREVALAAGAGERLWVFTPATTRPGDVAPAHGGVTVGAAQLRHRGSWRRVFTALSDDGVEVVNARWPLWRKSAVEDAHAAGLLAFAWDVQWRLARWRCERIGIDGIFSDHVHLLRPGQPA